MSISLKVVRDAFVFYDSLSLRAIVCLILFIGTLVSSLDPPIPEGAFLAVTWLPLPVAAYGAYWAGAAWAFSCFYSFFGSYFGSGLLSFLGSSLASLEASVYNNILRINSQTYLGLRFGFFLSRSAWSTSLGFSVNFKEVSTNFNGITFSGEELYDFTTVVW